MSAALLDAAKSVLVKLDYACKRLGAPGDYGYDTKEGMAVLELHKATAELAQAIHVEGATAQVVNALVVSSVPEEQSLSAALGLGIGGRGVAEY